MTKIIEKGDGMHKATVWIDDNNKKHTSCYICDLTNQTTELCKSCRNAYVIKPDFVGTY